ncbi:MAG: hypothetical protein HZB26_17115 [Candidatus Hydrogenedentes bacterium]|nr:hypothetical protein [Candidatus Hydrogenedentota bacterium]
MKRCHRCATEYVSAKKQPGPKDTCESCLAYLHSCLNCRFYEEHAHNNCYIPTTDWVADKEGPNFCDEFEFSDSDTVPGKKAGSDSARDAFGALFGGSPDESESKKGVDDFKKLFGG